MRRGFKVVKTNEVKLGDWFLKHNPKTENERIMKQRIIKAIKSGVEDFMAPTLDPSVQDGKLIFKSNMEPAIGFTMEWWENAIHKFDPNARIGKIEERVIFVAIIIKQLSHKIGRSRAWAVCCNNSSELGVYFDSDKSKKKIERTGSENEKNICWRDLSNVRKLILGKDKEVLITGGYYLVKGNQMPLASIEKYGIGPGYNCSLPWIIIPIKN